MSLTIDAAAARALLDKVRPAAKHAVLGSVVHLVATDAALLAAERGRGDER